MTVAVFENSNLPRWSDTFLKDVLREIREGPISWICGVFNVVPQQLAKLTEHASCAFWQPFRKEEAGEDGGAGLAAAEIQTLSAVADRYGLEEADLPKFKVYPALMICYDEVKDSYLAG